MPEAQVFKRNWEPKRCYPPGNDFGAELANYVETNINATSAVGCFLRGASPYGVEELSGNVWEWLHNRTGLQAGGSSWSDIDNVILSVRGRFNRHLKDYSIGFRCVVVPISR
jgi:formylglycine-generating enzyme required for sulfatase activity